MKKHLFRGMTMAGLAAMSGSAGAQSDTLYTLKELHLYTYADKEFITAGEPVRLEVWANTTPPKGSFVTSTSWINGKTFQGEIGMFLYVYLHFRALVVGVEGKWSYLDVHPKMTYEWPKLYPDRIEWLLSQMKYYPNNLDDSLPIFLFTATWTPKAVPTRTVVRFLPDANKASLPYPPYHSIRLVNANTGSGFFGATDFDVIEHPADIILLPEPCAVDCDTSGTLDINDLMCFQTLFATADPYADCDGDGQLLIDDFICYQTLFAIGC